MGRKNSLTAIGIVNTITKSTNATASVQLPFVDKSTFSDFGKQLAIAPDEYRNGWIDNLINLCGLQIILGKRMYESYFKKFYREQVLTENIQLSMVDAIKAKAYDPEATARILENEPPRVGVQYISSVLKRQYQVSDVEDLLTSAFVTEGAFMSFMDAVTTQLYSSMEDDNVTMIKEMLNQNIAEGNVRLVPLAKPTDQSSLLTFMYNVKKIGADWDAERSREWNLAGFRTFSPNDDHYFILNTDMDSLNSIYNLPWAFNREYLTLRAEGEAVVMGSSALCDGNVYAILCDKDWLQIHDRINHPRYTSFFNPGTLSQNRFLTCFTVLSIAFFANAVAFIAPSAVGIASATLDTRDGSTAANRGEVKEVYVKSVTADSGKYADKFGKFSLTGNTDTNTYIDEDSGELFIGANESGTVAADNKYYVTVTWTSHLDENVTATKAIQINV